MVLSSHSWTWEGVRGPTGPSGRGGQHSGPQPLTSRPLKDQDFVSTSCFMTKTLQRPLVQKTPTSGPGRSQDSAALGGKVQYLLKGPPAWLLAHTGDPILSAPAQEPSLTPLFSVPIVQMFPSLLSASVSSAQAPRRVPGTQQVPNVH